METLLKSLIQELELSIPQAEIKGAYAPGDDYEFCRDLKNIVEGSATSLFIIDNYSNAQLFDLYIERVQPRVEIRILTDQLRGAVQVVAEKFAKRGQFELRMSSDAHDRHVFVDHRGWVSQPSSPIECSAQAHSDLQDPCRLSADHGRSPLLDSDGGPTGSAAP